MTPPLTDLFLIFFLKSNVKSMFGWIELAYWNWAWQKQLHFDWTTLFQQVPHYLAIIAPYTWFMWFLIIFTFIFVITPALLFFREAPQTSVGSIPSRIIEAYWEMFVWSSCAFDLGRGYTTNKTSSRIFFVFTMAYVLLVTWAYRYTFIRWNN